MSNLLRTPLYEEHLKLNGRMVPFAGWEMPVQYIGVKEEHLNVRKNVGLFDVSHMGEIRFKGIDSLAALEWLTTNEVAKLTPGQAQYSLLPNETGGLVDDIIVYCIDKGNEYLVCVNASNKDKDFQWMKSHVPQLKNLTITDESSQWGQIAVQGPKAVALLTNVLGLKVETMKPFHFVSSTYKSTPIIMATTGYTGEKGGEIFVKAEGAAQLWRDLLEAGKEFGAMAIGLGARDTLRTEMKYSLYGHEINDEINPYSAGLGWVIKPTAKDFVGKSAMLAQKEKGLPLHLVGFKMLDKGISRQGYPLYNLNGGAMGTVSSGTFSPSLNESIGLGFVDANLAKEGSEFFIEIRGKKLKAVVCKTPFVEAGGPIEKGSGA